MHTLNGGDGNDDLDGGGQADTLNGGAGDDWIDAEADGASDSVTCGTGFDTVYRGAGDSVAGDCEDLF